MVFFCSQAGTLDLYPATCSLADRLIKSKENNEVDKILPGCRRGVSSGSFAVRQV
jgi:hypothetical protein